MNSHSSSSDQLSTPGAKQQFLIPLIIFLTALTLRIVYTFQLKSGSPLYDFPVVDALMYDSWGWKIAQGDWLGERIFYDPPLYAYFLGIIYKIFGHNYLAPRIIQALLGSLNCVLIYFVTKRLVVRAYRNTPLPKVGVLAGSVAGFLAAF